MANTETAASRGTPARRRRSGWSGSARSEFLRIDEIALVAEATHHGETLERLRLHGAWAKAVGAQLRVIARPARCDSRRLLVDVKDLAWKRELERLKPEILARLSKLLPAAAIGDISFRVRSGCQSSPAPGALRGSLQQVAGVSASAEVSAELRTALSNVSDEVLRDRLGSVMGKYLAAFEQASPKPRSPRITGG